MEIPLDGEIEQVVRAKVDSAEYQSVAHLVEEALFLLVERDWLASQHDLRERAPFVFDGPDAATPEGNGS